MKKIVELIKENYPDVVIDKQLLDLFCNKTVNKTTVEVCGNLIKFKLDLPTIFAYIAYSEDIDVSVNDEINQLKKSIEDVDNIKIDTSGQEAEVIRRMFIAMSKDLRIVIVKLCLILQEINLYELPINIQQKHILLQVQDIFSPLAERLGLNALKTALDDQCLKLLDNEAYRYLESNLKLKKDENELQINIVKQKFKLILDELKIKGTIVARQKHYSSIYKKMKKLNHSLAMIYDLIAVRVIVDKIEDCYAVLGKIHALYKPMAERFKDYIAVPKPNGYQSLHTTIIVDNDRPLEVQIRTSEMHRMAEYGVISHWLYKEKRTKQTDLDVKMSWIREIMETSADLSGDEFVETLKTNLIGNSIFVQTPKGKVIEFPEGSNVIDFAYAIHSNVGNCCVGAKVNSKISPLTTKLKNGDIVEILTSTASKGPSRDWLKSIKTAGARSKINAFFKKELKEDNIKMGKSIIDIALKNKGLNISRESIKKYLSNAFVKYNVQSEDEMYASVGYGSLPAQQIINRIINEYQKEQSQNTIRKEENIIVKTNKDGVLVDGYSGMLIRYAGCCAPLSTDEIVGYVSRGRGVTIHKSDCVNLKYLEKERLINACWGEEEQITSKFALKIISEPKEDIINSIMKIILTNNAIILKIDTSTNQVGNSITSLKLETKKHDDIYKIIKDLHNIDGIIEVNK